MEILKEKDCRFGITGLGVLVQRMSPGSIPHHVADTLVRSLSGAEYNPVMANSLWGIPGAYFTAKLGLMKGTHRPHPDGVWMDAHLRKTGVMPVYKEFEVHPLRGPFLGQVHTDTGFGARGPKTHYVRDNEAASLLESGDFDFDAVFSQGVRWAHTGGLFASLGPNTAELVLEYVKAAKAAGAIVSMDLNWRGMLWDALDDVEAHRETLRQIVSHLDVVVGNEEDWQESFGIIGPDVDKGEALNPETYEVMLRAISGQFPNLKVIATTLRQVVNAGLHMWQCVMLHEDEFFKSSEGPIQIMDRVGGGDGFDGGLFHGFLNGYEPQECLEFGRAHGALVAGYPTDTTMAMWDDVEALAQGKSARVVR